jgi:hypothetical protein
MWTGSGCRGPRCPSTTGAVGGELTRPRRGYRRLEFAQDPVRGEEGRHVPQPIQWYVGFGRRLDAFDVLLCQFWYGVGVVRAVREQDGYLEAGAEGLGRDRHRLVVQVLGKIMTSVNRPRMSRAEYPGMSSARTRKTFCHVRHSESTAMA